MRSIRTPRPSRTATAARRAAVAALLGAVALASIAGVADARGFGGGHAQADWAELTRIAERDGRVAIIASVTVGGADPSTLSSDRLLARSEAIAATKATLLDGIDGKTAKLKDLGDFPIIAFHATPGQLEDLRASGLVASVWQDRESSLDDESGITKGTIARTPKRADADARTRPSATRARSASPAGTSSSGVSSQLSAWWDWYRIGLDKSTAAGFKGAGQNVVIIDTGVDGSHPWLAGKVVDEACFSTNPVGVAGGGCPNGATYQYGAGSATPCTFAWICAHGTHVAHTAAGTWGVAPAAGIVAIQVFHRDPATGSPSWSESDLYAALWYVYNYVVPVRPVAAINMSLGYGGWGTAGTCDTWSSGAGQQVVNYVSALLSVGVPTVISSGNDDYAGKVSFPACISKAVTVGNSTITGTGADAVFGGIAGGSNASAVLDLLAPGTDICSAVPTWLDNDGKADGIDCSYIGTSMASPHVTGAFAVLKSARPSATVGTMLSVLKTTGTSVTDSRNGLIRTRINVWNALGKI